MNYYIGIDLGTSSVKVLLISESRIINSITREYPVYSPEEGYSEQNPQDWYDKTIEALCELLDGIEKTYVKAISFSGQMHGLVMLDKDENVLYPAILWNDGRSFKETEYLNNVIGKDFLLSHTGNIAFPGFTAPKIMWIKKNKPEIFEKISKVMLPKDYLANRLTGEFCTDVSDAAGTLYFDTKNRCWSDEMLQIIGICKSVLPCVKESCEIIGNLKTEIAKLLGLNNNVKVVIGAGDNAAAAFGSGTVKDGDCNISLGTSGTIYVESDKFGYDEQSAIHSFCSASGKYHYLACILSAARCQKWWNEDILECGYDVPGAEKYLGCNDVIFVPYLTGERSPINNTRVRAMFYGMTPFTTKEQLTLSVLEGVAFALKQNIEIIRRLGTKISFSKICGGGTKNELWLKIITSALNVTLEVPQNSDSAALGAALLAFKATSRKEDFEKDSLDFYRIKKTVKPDRELATAYNIKYKEYLKLSDYLSKSIE